jgi:phage terminase small subunit
MRRLGFFFAQTIMRQLTHKQKTFVDEYLVDLNATQAAIRAGYKENRAYAMGHENLKKPEIAEAIQEAMSARSERTEITSDLVLKELAKIGFANMADYMKCTTDGDPYLDFSKLTRDQAAALVEVTVEDFVDGRGEDARSIRRVKFKLADKRAALVDIGKHLNMFIERKEITGKDGGPIQTKTETTIVDPIQAARVYQEFIAKGS